MCITMLILFLCLFLHYSFVNCDAGKTDHFNEAVLMKKHRESMQKVNAFFRNLAIVLNHEKAGIKKEEEEETDGNIERMQQTVHLNLRAGSFAKMFYSTKSTFTKSPFPDYINKPSFPFSEGTENVLDTSARAGQTSGGEFKEYSTVKPSNLTFTTTSNVTSFAMQAFPKFTRPSNLPNNDRAHLFSPILTSKKARAVIFNQIHNPVKVANFITTNRTSSSLSAPRTVAKMFNKLSTFKKKISSNKSLDPSASITNVQRRYKVVSSKYHFKPDRERTTKYSTLNLHRRPTKGNSLQITHHIKTPFPYFHEQKDYLEFTKENKVIQRAEGKKRRQRHSKETIDFDQLKKFYNFDEYFLKDVRKISNKYLKRIVEASSYSDEEDSLKMHLYGTLFSNKTSTTETTKSLL